MFSLVVFETTNFLFNLSEINARRLDVWQKGINGNWICLHWRIQRYWGAGDSVWRPCGSDVLFASKPLLKNLCLWRRFSYELDQTSKNIGLTHTCAILMTSKSNYRLIQRTQSIIIFTYLHHQMHIQIDCTILHHISHLQYLWC